MNVAKMATAPWAKLSTPDTRKISTSPIAASA
jgi:hypothetical protein